MRNKMRLGDIATLITKGTTPTSVGYTFTDTGVNFVKIESIREDGTFIPDKFAHISDECNTKLKRSQLQENDILFSIAGAIGRTAIVTKDCLPANTNQALAIIRIPQGVIDYRFLLYALQSDAIIEQAEKQKQGVAQLNLSLQNINDFEIPFFTEEEQLTVVEVLSSVDSLLSTRIAQLEQLDELVKSRFIELFGDPVQNPMGWKIETLKKATTKIGSGATPKGGKESYQTEGITLIRSMNVHDGRFEYKDLAHITDEQAKQLENVTVEENDVFINITGASVARSCIVPKHILPARVNQHVAIIRCITSMLNPVFANQMFLNASFKGQLLDIGESGGATRQAITKQQLETITVILPPIELQEQFAAFVEQTDKSKLAVQQSITELEELKKSLMQKYFG